jgi:hypothetical protein
VLGCSRDARGDRREVRVCDVAEHDGHGSAGAARDGLSLRVGAVTQCGRGCQHPPLEFVVHDAGAAVQGTRSGGERDPGVLGDIGKRHGSTAARGLAAVPDGVVFARSSHGCRISLSSAVASHRFGRRMSQCGRRTPPVDRRTPSHDRDPSRLRRLPRGSTRRRRRPPRPSGRGAWNAAERTSRPRPRPVPCPRARSG